MQSQFFCEISDNSCSARFIIERFDAAYPIYIYNQIEFCIFFKVNRKLVYFIVDTLGNADNNR